MSTVMFEEVKQISAEMKAIVSRSEHEGRRMNRQEQETLDRLATDREALLCDIIFNGYG